jgi:hypothetical protein
VSSRFVTFGIWTATATATATAGGLAVNDCEFKPEEPPGRNCCLLHRPIPVGGDEGRTWLDADRQTFQTTAEVRLVPLESAAIDVVARAIGIGTATFER